MESAGHGVGKLEAETHPPESELSSVYYDARAEDEGHLSLSSRESPSQVTMNGYTRKRRRLRCWCCTCTRKNSPSTKEGGLESGGDAYSENASDDKKSVGTSKGKPSSATTIIGWSRSQKGKSSKGSLKTLKTSAGDFGPPRQPNQERRKRIQDRPDKNMNLWSVLKSAMSKDLLRNPLPVNFSEPLSMLQRLAEDYEYSTLLDKASKSNDQWEQICLVAAFCVASYGNTAIRTLKPFNPLLGETYEFDRMADLGWRYFSEQVCHHPPTAATHCEGSAGWTCWQDLTFHSKWHVNSCDFNPTGIAHLKFSGSGHHYTWKKVTTCVHNIIWGKLWVDQVGDTLLTNHSTGDFCKLQFIPTTWRQQKQVTGSVHTKSGHVKWTLTGSWDEQLVATPAVSKSKSKRTPSEKTIIGPQLLLKMKHPGVILESGYNMSEFACQLNELELGVAPTDSRLRPDQRLMEEGLWDEANLEKTRLEEKQRKDCKRWESEEDGQDGSGSNIVKVPYIPLWFRKVLDDTTSTFSYQYNEKYWEEKEKGNWSICPNIF